MRRALVLVLCLTACATPKSEETREAVAVVATGTTPDITPFARREAVSKPEISINWEDIDLRDAAAELSRISGHMVFCDPDVHEKITIRLKRIPWRDAVAIISRMAKCEVAEEDDALVFVPCCCLWTIDFKNVELRVVLWVLAAYAGHSIIIDPAVTGTTTVNIHGAEPITTYFQQVVDDDGLYVARSGEIFVVAKHPLAGGSADLSSKSCHWTPAAPIDLDMKDAKPEDVVAELSRKVGRELVLAEKSTRPVTLCVHASERSILRYLREHEHLVVVESPRNPPLRGAIAAFNAPARAWFELLASALGKELHVEHALTGRINLELFGEEPLTDALDASALACGFELTRKGDVIRVTGLRGETPDEVEDASVLLALEGVIITKEARRAIISGRVYREGEQLRSRAGDPLPIHVVSIDARSVVLDDHGERVLLEP
jgi:hypothetical protein